MILEGSFVGGLLTASAFVARDFGWRVYRKFGSLAHGAAVKRIYRERQIFAALLKLDVALSWLLLIATCTYMLNPYIWPDSHPTAPVVMLTALSLGVLWAGAVHLAVQRERTLGLLSLAPPPQPP